MAKITSVVHQKSLYFLTTTKKNTLKSQKIIIFSVEERWDSISNFSEFSEHYYRLCQTKNYRLSFLPGYGKIFENFLTFYVNISN